MTPLFIRTNEPHHSLERAVARDMTSDKSAHIARFGTHGVWGGWDKFSPEQARAIEELGYGTIWLGGSPKHLRPIRKILDATEAITVATGIVNIWNTVAAVIADAYLELEDDFPGRFYLGIGAGHREAIAEYAKPYIASTATSTFSMPRRSRPNVASSRHSDRGC